MEFTVKRVETTNLESIIKVEPKKFHYESAATTTSARACQPKIEVKEEPQEEEAADGIELESVIKFEPFRFDSRRIMKAKIKIEDFCQPFVKLEPVSVKRTSTDFDESKPVQQQIKKSRKEKVRT